MTGRFPKHLRPKREEMRKLVERVIEESRPRRRTPEPIEPAWDPLSAETPKTYDHGTHYSNFKLQLILRVKTTDPKGRMMWLFDPLIAEHRRTYEIPVRILALEGLASASRRTAKILTCQQPKIFPLDHSKPAEVEIEYTDNKSRKKRCFIPANDIDLMNPRNRCDLLVISGEKRGAIVKHVKTLQDKVKVREKPGAKPLMLPKSDVSPLEKHE